MRNHFLVLHHFFASFGLGELRAAQAGRAEKKPFMDDSGENAMLVHQGVSNGATLNSNRTCDQEILSHEDRPSLLWHF